MQRQEEKSCAFFSKMPRTISNKPQNLVSDMRQVVRMVDDHDIGSFLYDLIPLFLINPPSTNPFVTSYSLSQSCLSVADIRFVSGTDLVCTDISTFISLLDNFLKLGNAF